MLSVKAYYDGHNYITEGNVIVKPNQQVIITFLDDDFEAEKQNNEKKAAIEEMRKFFGSLSHEEAEEIRNNRMNFKERI
ncbi:MAG: hypothetical protein IKP49_02965 [Treponema sp.]|nr:hypothetical protein [Treponema sp.]